MASRHHSDSLRHFLATVMLPLAAIGACATAHAEDKAPEPDYTLSFNVGVTSDYRVRGIAQTSGKPAIQGGIDLGFKNGFYLGTAASNVRWVKEFNGASKGSYEVDLYGGLKGPIAETGVSYDVGIITYRYPGNDSGAASSNLPGAYSKADTTEIYGALTYNIVTFKYSRSLGDFLGNLNSSGSQYFDLSAAVDLTNGFTLTPHIGRQLIPNQTGRASYSDASLTLAKDFGNGISATASLIGSDADRVFYTDTRGRFLGDNTIVVGAKYTF